MPHGAHCVVEGCKEEQNLILRNVQGKVVHPVMGVIDTQLMSCYFCPKHDPIKDPEPVSMGCKADWEPCTCSIGRKNVT